MVDEAIPVSGHSVPVMEAPISAEDSGPEAREDDKAYEADFDPLDTIRGSSTRLDAVLAFRWNNGEAYLSPSVSRAMLTAELLAKADAAPVRPAHILRALLKLLPRSKGIFPEHVRKNTKAKRLLVLAEGVLRATAEATVEAGSGTLLHWEAVEVLAAASQLRRQTNRIYHDIGLRHVLLALFRTKEGQSAFREIGGFADGYEALRDSVVACIDARKFSDYGDDPEAWKLVEADLQRAIPLVERVERRPEYINDRVGPRSAAGAGQEPLGAAADAQALADLILLEAAEPPLAVGLFGPWGSGKSTLIEHLKAEIRDQTRNERNRRAAGAALPEDRTRIVTDVVQLSFNAWTFADSNNLWATFTSEIFDQLAAGGFPSASDDAGQEARDADLQTRAAAAALVSEVAARTAREAASLRVAEVETLEHKKAIESARLMLSKAETDRRSALAAGIAQALSDVRGAGQPPQTGSVLQLIVSSFTARGWRYAAAAAAVVAAALSLYFLRGHMPVPERLTQAAAASAVALAALWPVVSAAISAATHWAEHRRVADQHIAEARADLRTREASYEQAALQSERSKNFLKAYAVEEGANVATSPMRMLDYLLKESEAVAAVRAQTGLLATVRRCFEQLEAVIEDARQTPDRAGIDRIILYIDDLDRCSTRQVSEILQAVHLLLSFNCFVVIAAADANWLKQSLEEQHPQLFNDEAGRLSPADYLEKIFQIPFWVKPLVDADAAGAERFKLYEKYVDHLLREEEPAGEGRAARPSQDDGAGTAGDGGGRRSFTPQRPTRNDEPGGPARERILLSEGEKQFIKQLGPLAAKSPRAVKRLVNTYRLIRVRLEGQALKSFLEKGTDGIPSHKALLFTLACEVGLPPATMSAVAKALNELNDDEWNQLDSQIVLHRDDSPEERMKLRLKSRATADLIDALIEAKRLTDFYQVLEEAKPELSRRQVQIALDEVRRYSFRPL